MTWYLEYTTPEGEKQQLRIDEGTLRIGRGSTSDTRIEDSAMSRLHCTLTLKDNAPVLTDAGSAAGTIVHRKKIVESVVLSSGQSFQAGHTRFKILSDSPLDAPTQLPQSAGSGGELARLQAKLESKGKLDRFQLQRAINTSGRNLIFKAIDTETETVVAIKVLPTDEGTDEDEARFKRAMGILQELRDPCLVRLFRAGRKSNYCWVAMEWYPDGSLEDRAEKLGINNCLDWKDGWRVANCIAQSLHILEREKVVHRNIKPTSILVNQSKGLYVLSDLVVAKAQNSVQQALVTRQVFLPHDLAYTAPERVLGSQESEYSLQSDIYSLGAVLTKLLTGEPPYGHGELREMLPRLSQKRNVVQRQGQIGMNEMFVDLVNSMTEPEPRKRFPSALKLWQEVERVGKLAGLSAI